MNDPSLLRLNPGEKLRPDEQDSLVLNSTLTSTKTIIQLPTKTKVDSLHDKKRKRRVLSSVYKDQDNEFDENKLTNVDSITVNGDPSSDNELANKKYVDESIGQGNVLRFNKTLQNYLKVSVENDKYNLTEYDKLQNTVTIIIKSINTGGYLLQPSKYKMQ